MKITMYELLGMVKDGKAPKKIKYQNYIYEYQHRRDTESSFNYMCNENGEYLSRRYFIDNILNDEVEIIEEEKKIPEKIKVKDYSKCIHDVTHKEKEFSLDIRELQIRYNELLDYFKSKGE